MRRGVGLSVAVVAVGAALVTTAALVAGAISFATAAVAGSLQKDGGTLRIAGPRDLDSVDPAVAYTPDTWAIEFVTCATLYSYPDKPAPQGTVMIPEVAKRMPMVSRDGKTQTIELERSYRFHNGQRVTAANFVAAFNRNANPKMGSPATPYMREIVGADAVIAGKAKTVAGVRALGPYTLRIRTTMPLGDLATRLTMPFFCPIATDTPLSEVNAPLGSGPYYIASRVRSRQVVLERNRFYRGPRRANVDRIVRTISAPEACRSAIERDELDHCTFLAPTAYKEIAADYGINKGRFFFGPDLTTAYFAFNHDRPAFKGPGQIPLKQAINWAIDRPALVRAVGFLGGKRTDQILPPAMDRRASIYPLGGVTEPRLAKARALLARATFKPKKLVLYASSTGTFGVDPVWAQIFQFNLKRLGIDVDVRLFPHPSQFDKVGRRGEPYDIFIGGWGTDYLDGLGFFGPLLNGAAITKVGNSNAAYFDRARYNREIARIGSLTGEARRNAWAKLDIDMMRNDPPWAPFANGATRAFVSRSFGCFFFQPALGRVNLVAACKK